MIDLFFSPQNGLELESTHGMELAELEEVSTSAVVKNALLYVKTKGNASHQIPPEPACVG